MANIKISDLTSAGALAGTEVLPIVQSAATVKTPISSINALVIDGAPPSLDTLNKLAAAIGDDPNFSTTVSAAISAAVSGLSWKQAVRAATTAPGTLASSFENGDSIDGVTLVTGDRILIKDQSTASENGIYIVAATGAPTRATDADAGAELVNASVYVSEGTTLADTQWTCSTNGPITVGSTNLTFAQLTSGGGGGLTNFTDTLNSSAPNATVPVAVLAADNAATNVDLALQPKGTGAFILDVPDSGAGGGDKRGTYAVDLQINRSAATQVASGIRAVLIGGSGNTASGQDSAVLGGASNVANAQENVVIGGQANTAGGSYRNTVLGGYGNNISGGYENVAGGNGNTISASGGSSFAVGNSNSITGSAGGAAVIGTSNTVSGNRSQAFGQSNSVSGAYAGAWGFSNSVDADGTFAVGTSNYARGRKYMFMFSPGASGFDDTNTVICNLVGTTTDGTTAVKLTTNASTAASNNQLSMTSGGGQVLAFDAIVVVTNNANTAAAAFHVQGLCRGPSSVVVGTPVVTLIAADAALATCSLDVVADSANSAVAIQATGVAATTLRWNASVRAAYIR